MLQTNKRFIYREARRSMSYKQRKDFTTENTEKITEHTEIINKLLSSIKILQIGSSARYSIQDDGSSINWRIFDSKAKIQKKISKPVVK